MRWLDFLGWWLETFELYALVVCIYETQVAVWWLLFRLLLWLRNSYFYIKESLPSEQISAWHEFEMRDTHWNQSLPNGRQRDNREIFNFPCCSMDAHKCSFKVAGYKYAHTQKDCTQTWMWKNTYMDSHVHKCSQLPRPISWCDTICCSVGSKYSFEGLQTS